MQLVKNESVKKSVKVTAELSLPVVITDNDPLARIERRLGRLIANSDWVYDTLALIEKVLNNESNLSRIDQWTLDRLDLSASLENGELILTDRYLTVFDNSMLKTLKNKIISMTAKYSNLLLQEPELHHMKKAFKKALRKSNTRKLNEEEANMLKEAYLKQVDGKIVNLRGEAVTLPKFSFFSILGA